MNRFAAYAGILAAAVLLSVPAAGQKGERRHRADTSGCLRKTAALRGRPPAAACGRRSRGGRGPVNAGRFPDACGAGPVSGEYGFVKACHPWLSSSNASGLGTLLPAKISSAVAFFREDDGGFTLPEKAGAGYSAGAATESYARLSPRISLFGRLSYSHDYGRSRRGQILFSPERRPVNFIETTDTTAGARLSNLYRIAGGLSYRLHPCWTLGLSADFTSGDRAKRKDPRYRSNLLDLSLGAGGRFAPSPRFSVGLNALYEREIEEVTGKPYGYAAQTYFTFIDYGGFYGKYEPVGEDNGYVPKSTPNIVFHRKAGAALQLDFGRRTRLFNEIRFLAVQGYFGDKTSSSVVYFENGGFELSYFGTLLLEREGVLHRLSLSAGYVQTDNFENSYRRNTVPGENTVVEYFGRNRVLDRGDAGGRLAYAGWSGTAALLPVWKWGAALSGGCRHSVTTIYPYRRTWDIGRIEVRAEGERTFSRKRDFFTLHLGLGFGSGFRPPVRDARLAGSSSAAPASAEEELLRTAEALAAARLGGTIGFRYTRLTGAGLLHAELRENYTHALRRVEHLSGSFRNGWTLAVGLTF